MVRTGSGVALRLDFGEQGRTHKASLRLATPVGRALRGPKEYQALDVRRRRAQIRARRMLGLK
jgi:hypothetical protein